MTSEFVDPHAERAPARAPTRALATTAAVVGSCALLALLLFAGTSTAAASSLGANPNWWLGVLPFTALLAAIAVFPLIPVLREWWHSNLNRYLCTLTVSALALGWIGYAAGLGGVGSALHHAIPAEYVPFLSLLFALYVIAGGIHIETPFTGRPGQNHAILLTGALAASLIGTTGAAMLLIRPLLDSLRHRTHKAHTIVFFIFIVCNCGGCLLPIGDPPLFMGYLRGVPFFWTLSLWSEWLVVNGLLLTAYLVIDLRMHAKELAVAGAPIETPTQMRRFRIQGAVNFPLLVLAVACVALVQPGSRFFGSSLVTPAFLREGLLLALAGLSVMLTPRAVRTATRFEYGAIIEVAAIFLGIFITMQTPLAVLEAKGPTLGLTEPIAFYWITGALSSFLDNAPTYVVFMKVASTLPIVAGESYIQLAGATIREDLLTSISLGAVFMGANTYIGNGPNFMVKAIAESEGIAMPSFFGYMAWSIGILVPLLALAQLFFP